MFVCIGGSVFVGVLFFLVVVIVILFGVGLDFNLLVCIGFVILWIGVLLVIFFGLDWLF